MTDIPFKLKLESLSILTLNTVVIIADLLFIRKKLVDVSPLPSARGETSAIPYVK